MKFVTISVPGLLAKDVNRTRVPSGAVPPHQPIGGPVPRGGCRRPQHSYLRMNGVE